MKPTLLIALALAFASGCVTDEPEPLDAPVVGEAEAVTEVEDGPAEDSLLLDDAELADPTYVPEEESVQGDGMVEGEVLEPDGE